MGNFRFGQDRTPVTPKERLTSHRQSGANTTPSTNEIKERYERQATQYRNFLIIGCAMLLFGGIYYTQPDDTDIPPPSPPNVNMAWIPTPYTNIECSINNPTTDRPSCSVLNSPIMTGVRNISAKESATVGATQYRASDNIGWKLLIDKCSSSTIKHGESCTIILRINPRTIQNPGYYHVHITADGIPSDGGVMIKADP